MEMPKHRYTVIQLVFGFSIGIGFKSKRFVFRIISFFIADHLIFP